jgi:hypothetical protein
MTKPSLAASFGQYALPAASLLPRQLVRNFTTLGIDCLLSGAFCGPVLADSNTNQDSGASCYGPINWKRRSATSPMSLRWFKLAQKYCPTILETY